jgi:hypothetical protein
MWQTTFHIHTTGKVLLLYIFEYFSFYIANGKMKVFLEFNLLLISSWMQYLLPSPQNIWTFPYFGTFYWLSYIMIFSCSLVTRHEHPQRTALGVCLYTNFIKIVTVTKLHASRPRRNLTLPLPLLDLLRWELWAVFTRLGSTLCVTTLYDSAVTLKHAICWRLL